MRQAITAWRRSYWNETSPYAGTIVPSPPSAPRRYTSGRTSALAIRRAGGLSRRGRRFRPGRDRSGGRWRANPSIPGNFKDASYAFTLAGTSTLAIPSSSGTGAVCVNIPENTSDQGRLGRRIALKSLLINGSLNIAQNGSRAQDIFHMYLVVDSQANGAYPVSTDIWNVTSPCSALVNLDNVRRFKILKHYMWIMNTATQGNALGAFSDQTRQIKKFINLRGLVIEYSATLGIIAEIKSNNLLVVCASQYGAVTFNGYYRLRFSDN